MHESKDLVRQADGGNAGFVDVAKDKLADLMGHYVTNSALRAIVQLISIPLPVYGISIGAAFDAAVGTAVANHQRAKFQTLLAELEAQRLELTDEIIANNEFLNNTFAVGRIVATSRSKDKIRMAARLLASFTNSRAFKNSQINDTYADLFHMLDVCRIKDIAILLALKEIFTEWGARDAAWYKDEKNTGKDPNEFRNALAKEMEEKFFKLLTDRGYAIEPSEMRGEAGLIAGTGLGYIADGTGAKGFPWVRPTKKFDQFLEFIKVKSLDDFDWEAVRGSAIDVHAAPAEEP